MIVELFPPHTARAFEALRELRPGLTDQEAFVEQVDSVQRAAGYRIIAWVAGDDAPALAVAGFRTGENFARGRYLYIDDLSTLPDARQRGYARSLLQWVHQEALRLECDQIHVDSRVEAERLDAHRLYLNAGYRISSYHFARTV